MNEKETEDKSKPNSLAVTSLALGFWGAILPFLAAIPAVICGHIALSRIKNNPSDFSAIDKRLAIGGLIFGYFSIIAWGYIIFLGLAIVFNWDLKELFPFGMRA